MMGRTHAATGGFAWVAGCAVVAAAGFHPRPFVTVAGGVLSAGAALLPDLDHPSSLISRSLGPVTGGLSWVVRRLSGGHRGVTHSLLFAAVLGGLVSVAAGVLLGGAWWWLGGPVAVGCAAHCVGDSATRCGAPLWWPVVRRDVGRRWLSTGCGVERWVIGPLVTVGVVGLGGLLLSGGL